MLASINCSDTFKAAAWRQEWKEKLPNRRRSSRKKRKRNPVKHGASRALLSCLCTAQLSDIIFLPLPGGVSGELPLSKKPSTPLLNHRFAMFHCSWRRPGSHCACFHGHWEALCVMWLKVSCPWAELPSFQWEAK